MFDSVPPAESEPNSVVSSDWLWAARGFALICAIALGIGYIVDEAHYELGYALMYGPRELLSLAMLFFSFRRGKNSLAFALGLGAATAFVALYDVASFELLRNLSDARPGIPNFLLEVTGGTKLPPFYVMMNEPNPQLATLGLLLFWSFNVCSAMLGLSSVVAFTKMAHKAKGMGKLRLAFGAGICCPVVIYLICVLVLFIYIAAHPFGM